MIRRNWLDLSRKLVDRFDLDFTVAAIQEALGEAALSYWGEGVLLTTTYPNPFPITMSGSLLGGSVGNGIGYDPNGQITRIDSSSPTSKAFTIATANSTNPRWDLLVIRYKQTGDTPVPKPSDPISTVNLNLHDDFVLAVVAGTPSGSPAYPAKGANDIILAGLKVPANATLGTSVTVDLSIREKSSVSANRVTVDTSAFRRVLDSTDDNVQSALNDIDAEINKFFGQLLCIPHPSISSRMTLTSSDVTMKDGSVRSQIITNLIADFAGAQLEFAGGGAGNVYAPDGTTVIGTFTMPSTPIGNWRWFAVAVTAGTINADNRVSLTVLVTPAATSGVSQNASPRAEFVEGIPCGEIAVHKTGSSTVAPITHANIVQLEISSTGSGAAAAAAFIQETPAGVVDGSNADFTLSQQPLNPTSVLMMIDDVVIENTDWSITGQVVTFASGRKPVPGQFVYAYYIAQGPSPLSGYQEKPAGAVDGTNDTFTLAGQPANQASMLVTVDGVVRETSEWILQQGPTVSRIVFNAGSVPTPGQTVYVFYLVNAASVGSGIGGGAAVGTTPHVENRIISSGEATAKQLTLALSPYNSAFVVLDVKNIGPQVFGDDFTVSGSLLSWGSLGLDGIVNAGDTFRVLYFT